MSERAKHTLGITVESKDFTMADLPGILDKVQMLEVDSVELALIDCAVIAGGRVLPKQLQRMRSACEDRPVGFSLHAAIGINFMCEPAHLPLHRDVAEASIEVAAAIGARNMVVHSGFVSNGESRRLEHAYHQQREELSRLGDKAGAAGVVICVENVFSFRPERHTASPARLASELAAIDHPSVRATFDFSHGFLQCGQLGLDYLTEAKALAPFASHLHIHDSFGRPRTFPAHTEVEELAFGIGDLHLPVGWGAMPWRELMQETTLPSNALFNIELHRPYWSEVEDCIAATRDLMAMARAPEAV